MTVLTFPTKLRRSRRVYVAERPYMAMLMTDYLTTTILGMVDASAKDDGYRALQTVACCYWGAGYVAEEAAVNIWVGGGALWVEDRTNARKTKPVDVLDFSMVMRSTGFSVRSLGTTRKERCLGILAADDTARDWFSEPNSLACEEAVHIKAVGRTFDASVGTATAGVFKVDAKTFIDAAGICPPGFTPT